MVIAAIWREISLEWWLLKTRWCGRYNNWDGSRCWGRHIINKPVGIKISIIKVGEGVINLSKAREGARCETQVT
jgi:hypothetical protein